MNLDALSIGAYDSLVRVLAKTREIGGDANSETGPAEHRLLMYEEGLLRLLACARIGTASRWRLTGARTDLTLAICQPR